MSATQSQKVLVNVVAWSVVLMIGAIVALDIWAIVRKQGATDTISAHIRNWNAGTGGVLALFSAALWIHLCARLPFTWTESASKPFKATSYA